MDSVPDPRLLNEEEDDEVPPSGIVVLIYCTIQPITSKKTKYNITTSTSFKTGTIITKCNDKQMIAKVVLE
jgi:hypothetical protein